MKIGIYTPYLDSFGGGERYILTISEVLSDDHQVDLLFDKHHLTLQPENLITALEERLNLNLSKVNLAQGPLGEGSSFLKRLLFFKKYDVLIYLTDGSLFYSTAKHNIVHFQVPFSNIAAKGLWGKIKLSSWNLAICNSKFTENYIKKEWPIKTRVVYPPVAVESIKSSKKKKQILSVGRFTSFTKSKKHEEMINAFKSLFNKGEINDWSLHLAGSVEGDESYITELKEISKGAPVFFYPDLKFEKLVKLYGETSIYWHAAGLGEADPTKLEHFGITTVEAMAGGCVPVVINEGGQPEIVENNISGFLWEDVNELQKLTLKLIKDSKLMQKLSKNAIERSKVFSKERFKKEMKSIIGSI